MLTGYGARVGVAALLAAAAGTGVARYPLSPWVLAVALTGYAILLWRRPAAFLLVLPCVLPAWDCGLWTGWMMVGEADFFVLATVAVLLIRTPPALADLWLTGTARAVLLLFVACWTVAAVAGLCSTLGAPPSDNAFLRPDNALRLAKGLAEAVALLPFLRQRQRVHGDAVLLLGHGMAAGVVIVAVIVLLERALFTTILDFSGAYRVAGPFSSMRVGGGHIGAYLALALPMTICLIRLRPRWLGTGLLLATCLMGGYALAVTFARAGYVAGLVAMIVAGLCGLWSTRLPGRRAAPWIGCLLLILAVLVLAAASTGMRARFAATAQDLLTRQDNWQAGLAVRDTAALPTLFGMGLGTYQRAMLMRSPVNRPTDIVVGHDGDGAYVRMRVGVAFFLGQKVTLPSVGNVRLTMLARSLDDHATIGILLCDKVLLYSDHCRGNGVMLDRPHVWQSVTVTLPVQGLGGQGLGLFHRPVELSLFGGPFGHAVDVRGVQLVDNEGRDAVTNGDFTRGLDRWIFTDDSHVSWRILNQYLMLWFETGIVGLAAFLALAGLALAGSGRTVLEGNMAGAGVGGAVTGLLICGLFDNVLEAPRLATLCFVACFCGLLQWENRRSVPVRSPWKQPVR